MYAFGLSVLVGLLTVTTIALPAPAAPPQTFPMADDAPCSCLAHAPDGSTVRIPLNNTMPPFSVGLTQCITGTTISGCPPATP